MRRLTKKHIAVKSTKYFGQLLLLETKDWNEAGEYIPNQAEGNTIYDYIILVRLEPEGARIMSTINMLKKSEAEIPMNYKKILRENILMQHWKYDIPGFILRQDLIHIIHEKQIIPQGAKLNGRKSMDASNYYVQAGNLHDISEIYTYENKDKRRNVLSRRCPECRKNNLIVRLGPHGRFWGCSGYPECCHTENL